MICRFYKVLDFKLGVYVYYISVFKIRFVGILSPKLEITSVRILCPTFEIKYMGGLSSRIEISPPQL